MFGQMIFKVKEVIDVIYENRLFWRCKQTQAILQCNGKAKSIYENSSAF